MLLKISDLDKSIGTKELFNGLGFTIEEGDKVALIGRNGLGKTTLFKLITGEDNEFRGQLELKKDIRIIMTRQEHFLHEDITALDYILNDIPEFRELQSILKHHEEHLTDDLDEIQAYTDAIMKFSELGYYEVENKVIQSLQGFQIDLDRVLEPLSSFSGGEKRFVELVRVMYSGATLALIDEPTNHMDYVGKELFINWLDETEQTIFVITHDRDVLKHVNKIFELKDKQITTFKGNYDSYIKQNNTKTTSAISTYETDLKKLSDLKRKIDEAAKRKAYKAGKIVYDRLVEEHRKLKDQLEKPSFWIDKESLNDISKKTVESYHKYKEKNISIQKKSSNEHKKELIKVERLSVGYTTPLFNNISLHLYHYDRVFIKGRNGAGKSTLIKTLVAKIKDIEPQATIFSGNFKFTSALKLGIYEQEIDSKYISMTLGDAIYSVYDEQDLPINQQKVLSLLGNYLFDPSRDAGLTMDKLSGGQKARFQLIKMLSNNPNFLILDEPTNHLDLPSIEQLEEVLQNFHGAIMYVTHDNYLVESLGGHVIEINSTTAQ